MKRPLSQLMDEFGATEGRSRATRKQPARTIRATTRAARATVEMLEDRRLLSGGSVDSTFGTSGVATFYAGSSPTVAATVIQSDGKIIEAGSTWGNATDMTLVRYNSNGSIDTSFGTGGEAVLDFGGQYDAIYAVAIQSDGKIVVGGYTGYFSGSTPYSTFALARFTSSGTLDTSFGSGGKVTTDFGNNQSNVRALAIQSNGKIIAAGNNYNSTTNSDFAIARFNSDGSLDTTFGSGGKVTTDFSAGSTTNPNDSVTGAALQSDGRIVLAGNSGIQIAVARYNTDGSLDAAFNSTGTVLTQLDSGGQSAAIGVGLTSTGKIVVGGERDNVPAVVRYTSSGALDTSFNSTGFNTNSSLAGLGATGVAVQADDKVLLSGQGNYNGSVNTLSVARFNTDGSIDSGFGSSGIASVTSTGVTTQYERGLAIESDGKVVLGADTSSSTYFVAARLTLTNAPTANAGGPYTVNEGSTTALSGASSTDPDGEALTYQWDLNYSGTFNPTATGVSPTFSAGTLAAGATKTVAVRVTDLLGMQSTSIATGTVTVSHVAPTVGISGPSQASRDDRTTWALSASGPGITTGNEPITSWTINWGDKQYDNTNYTETFSGNPSSVTHVYTSAGTFNVTATATDSYGNYTTSTQTITVATGVYYDMAAGKPVYASSTATGSSPANAIDGNSSTAWTSVYNVSECIYVDLGAMTDISRVKITWGSNYASTFMLKMSNDSLEWKTMTATLTSSGTVDDLTGLSTDARYIMLVPLTAKSGGTNFQVASFEVYGANLAAGRAIDSAHPSNADTNQIFASSGSGLANAVDTDGTTQWVSSAGGTQWVIVDMSDAVNVNMLRVTFGAHYAATYHIAVGNDTTHWTTLGSEQSGHAGLNEVSLAGVGRYVLIGLDSTASGASNYQINDIALYGSNDLEIGLPTSASTWVSGGAPAQATDTDTSTAWISATDTTHAAQPYVTVDLGNVYNVNAAVITWGSDYATAFSIQESLNGSTFTTSGSYTGQTGGVFGTQVYVSARYLRILCTGYSTNRFSIKDLTIVGTVNLAYARAVAASSFTGTNYGTNVADEDSGTQWVSNGFLGQSLFLDLGTSVNVSAMNIVWGSAYASTYSIAISNDGSTWTALLSGGLSLFTGSAGGNYLAGMNATGRYVLISPLTPALGQFNFSIRTVEVFANA